MDGIRRENSHSFHGYFRGECAYEEILTKEQKDMETIIHDLRTFRLDSALFSTDIISKLI